MKKEFLFTLILSAFSLISFAQTNSSSGSQNLTIYTGVGYQHYNGDLGNGLYNFKKKCTWGTITLGLDYKIRKSIDIKVFGTIGALGYIQPNRPHTEEENIGDHEHGSTHEHGTNPETENLNAGLASGVIALQYRFANGYILPEDSKWAPSVYLGVGINYLTDPMEMECINTGFYTTINAGTAIHYNINSSFFVGAKFNCGLFTSDELDFIEEGGNDLHLQSSFVFGHHF